MARERVDVCVIGAGLLGLCAARALRQRGRAVTVLEAATVGNERAGSKGAVRVFRLGYANPKFVRMAMAARPRWHELEAEAGCQLLWPTDQFSFGDLRSLIDAMKSAGAPVEPMKRAEINERYPAFGAPADGVYEPASAVIDAAATLGALHTGDVREHTTTSSIVDDGRRVLVNETIECEVAVVCAGPHTGALVSSVHTVATLEHVAYFDPMNEPMPIFINYASTPALYGLPADDSYKIGFHHAGVEIDPQAPFVIDDAQVDAIATASEQWLPSFDRAPSLVEVCVYDNTPDEDFILRREGNVVIGAGTSGHGFKFGPLLGERLADLALRS